jgi:RES domain
LYISFIGVCSSSSNTWTFLRISAEIVDIARGAEPFYDDSQNYEEIDAIEKREREEWEERWYENRFRYQWQDFCEKVQYGRRFFQLKEPLDALFGDPKEYERGTIPPLYTLPVGQKIYRARLIDDGLKVEKLRQNPADELGAPPKELTRAGRMNVEYIPAFYAAFSEETAVAEIRPGIGEQIAIGEFVLQHELKVFDFTAFARADRERWGEAYAHTRYDFIDQMEGEISKPILPFDRQREYIPTQIVAEYIREYFGCDAVIYRSSMIKVRDKESRNIVFLNRGEAFTGTQSAPLAFSRYTAKEIADITYELSDAWPF